MHSGDPQKGTAPIAAFASASTVVVISSELHTLHRSINSSARSLLLFHDTLEADSINVSAISHPLQPLYHRAEPRHTARCRSHDLDTLHRSTHSSISSILLFLDTVEADSINVSVISHPLQPLYHRAEPRHTARCRSHDLDTLHRSTHSSISSILLFIDTLEL